MNIIILNSKADFTDDQILLLESVAEVSIIEEKKNYQDNPVFYSGDPKIIVLGPDVVEWNFPNSFIEKIPNLKAVCIPTTSFSWIDGEYLRKNNIDLLNVPHYSTESVAEYAIFLMLGLVKKVPLLIENDWKLDYEKHKGWEIKGKTMGVIGLGSIGKRIAEMGKALGMRVVYWSQKSRDDNFEYKEIDELLKESDFVFPALAKNKMTENILNQEKLDKMKKGSFIVSITGDDLFDLEYASKLLKEGRLYGIALESDKYSYGNIDASVCEGNTLVTPPVAWYTKEASEENSKIWIENVLSVIEGKPQNVVN